jgi:hypothetical protein
VSALDELVEQIRNEVFHAKTLVRQTRNHTKVTAAALQDSEDRLDRLIDRLDSHRNPRPEEAQDDQNGRHEAHAPVR